MKKEKTKKKTARKEKQRQQKAKALSKKSSTSSKTKEILELKTGGKSTVIEARTEQTSRSETSFLRRSRTTSDCKLTKKCS